MNPANSLFKPYFANLLAPILPLFAAFTVAASAAIPTLSLPVPVPGTTTTTPDKASNIPFLSEDGRYLTFTSNATNLIAGFSDNNEASQSGGANDIYQKDMQTGTIVLVSHADGFTAKGMNSRHNGQPRASSDGRFVFFASDSTDLVTGKGGAQRPYLWDRTTGNVTFIANVQTQGLDLSADGNWMAIFASQPTMPKNVYDPAQENFASSTYTPGFLINRVSGAVTLITHVTGSPTSIAAADMQNILVSADGRYAAFECTVIPGWDSYTGSYVTNSEAVYLYDRDTDTIKLVTKRNNNAAPSTLVTNPTPIAISSDGRYVYFNLADIDFGTATADTNGVTDTYRYDRDGGTTKLSRFFYDVYPLNPSPGAITINFSFSSNGRYLAFASSATNLVSGDTNARSDIFRFDTTNSSMERMNVNSDGSQWTSAANGTYTASFPRAMNNGSVLFVSTATNIGFTDTNAASDIILASYPVPSTAPSISSPISSLVTGTTANLGGNVTADGGAVVTERGVVYSVTSTNGNPLIGGNGVVKVTNAGTTGAFDISISGLSGGTSYTFKAYATNSVGTSYTSAGAFTTLEVLTPIQTWRKLYYGAKQNNGSGANTTAPDGDGLANLVKYALVLTPGSSSVQGLPTATFTTSGGKKYLSISIKRDPARTDVRTIVESSANLLEWSTVASSENGAAFSGAGFVGESDAQGGLKLAVIRDTVEATGPKRFMRVRAEITAAD